MNKLRTAVHDYQVVECSILVREFQNSTVLAHTRNLCMIASTMRPIVRKRRGRAAGQDLQNTHNRPGEMLIGSRRNTLASECMRAST